MFSRLEAASNRLDELTEMMSRPEVAADHRQYQSLAREAAGLRQLIEAYREFKKTQEEIATSQGLLNDPDVEVQALAREEILGLRENEKALERKLKLLLIPKDPNEGKNLILEIRAGTGGEEAAIFVGDIYRMYVKYAEKKGWKYETLSASVGSQGGYKEVISLISGADAYAQLKYEGGVHRVQRVPETEQQGRIHTSAITVAILPEADEVEIKIEEKDLKIDVYRSGGPGGQSVNTTDSAVRITHLPTGLVVVCQDEKSQIKNRSKALKILTSRLLAKKQEEQDAKISAQRRSMVGSGDRSERIRTYNFPQGRLTDHRIGLTLYRLAAVMEGDLDEIITALTVHDQTELLKAGSDKAGGQSIPEASTK